MKADSYREEVIEGDVSLISMHPFVKKFILSAIYAIREKEYGIKEKFVLHADMVPKFSEKVVKASMGEKVVAPAVVPKFEPRPVVVKDVKNLVAPIEPVKSAPQVKVPPFGASPRKFAPVTRPVPVVVPRPPVQHLPPPVKMHEGPVDPEAAYGKIAPLLNDPSVSTIECMGKGKELMVIRAGQKSRTRIVLAEGEIKGVLDKVADDAHIPLMDGVFRATVKGFSINAVVSETIGSRFVIKKANAYAMLER